MSEVQLALSSEVIELVQHLGVDGCVEFTGFECSRGKKVNILCYRDSDGNTTFNVKDDEMNDSSLVENTTGTNDSLNVFQNIQEMTSHPDRVTEEQRGGEVQEFVNQEFVNQEFVNQEFVPGSSIELEYEEEGSGIELQIMESQDCDAQQMEPQQQQLSVINLIEDAQNISVFLCYRCSQQFPKLQTLKCHLKRCHNEEFDESQLRTDALHKGCVCRLCQYVAINSTAIRAHMMRKHKLVLEQRKLKTDPKRLMWSRRRLEEQKAFPKVPCLICGTEISLLKNYAAHIKRLHREDPLYAPALKHIEEIRFSRESRSSCVFLPCPLCSQLQDGAKILKHLRWIHFGDPCIKSAVESTRKLLLQEKKRIQTEELQEKTECPHCKRNLRKISLQNHLKFYCSNNTNSHLLSTPATSVLAPEEGKVTDAGAAALMVADHQVAVNRQMVTCEFCGKKIAFVKYGRHRRMVHKVSINKPVDSLLCSFCSKTFTEPHQLKTHLMKHTKEQLTICLLCYKWFCDEYVYQEHIRKVHCSEFQFNCNRCGRGFWKEKTFKVHVCNYSELEVNCEKRASQKKKMALLMKLERPLFVKINPYEENSLSPESSIVLCLLCKKSFVNKASFELHHDTVHLAQYRHSCQHCGRNFIHKRQMQKHKCRPEKYATNVQKQMHEKQTALADRENYFGPSSVMIERRHDIANIMADELPTPEDDVCSGDEQTSKIHSLELGNKETATNRAVKDKSCAYVMKDVYEKIRLQLQTTGDQQQVGKKSTYQESFCIKSQNYDTDDCSKDSLLTEPPTSFHGPINVVLSNCIDRVPTVFLNDDRVLKIIAENRSAEISVETQTKLSEKR